MANGTKKKRVMSTEARKKISDGMKARYAKLNATTQAIREKIKERDGFLFFRGAFDFEARAIVIHISIEELFDAEK